MGELFLKWVGYLFSDGGGGGGGGGTVFLM